MKAKILSLNIDKSMSFARFQARIESSIKAYADSLNIQQFEDIREMFVALQDAFENDELIITAVDVKYFLKFKNALIQAFGTDVVYNPSVLNKIEGLDIDDKKKKLFSAFPEPATVFISDDGLYSGLGMENNNQYLLLLPIDNNRIDGILRNGVVPFLSEHIFSGESYSEFIEEKSINTEKVTQAVQRLINSNSVVAINGTRNAEVLKSCGDFAEGFSDVFVFTPHVEDKGNVNATEYTAQLAKVSLDLSAANIGACISDIYSSGDVKYICIAVAGEESAVVRKLYMSENETESAFVESAAIELIELIGEKADGKRSIGIEISDDIADENIITEEDKKSVGKKPLAILAIVLGVVIILCAVIGIAFKSQGNDGQLSGFFDTIFGREEPSTTETTTVPPETTTNPPKVIDTSLMKLSDYVVSNVMKMTNDEIAKNSIITDSKAPEFITVNGEKIEAKEALARLVTAELGSGYREETIKAQTVAIYTCLKFLGNDFIISGVQIADSYNDIVKKSVDSVFGEYLTYNGALAVAPYHTVTASKTLDMSAVLPYLKSVAIDGNPDVAANNYQTKKTYSVTQFKNLLAKNDSSLTLSENPKDWVVVKTHDSSVSDQVGNVTSVLVNGVEMTGIEFRMNVLGTSKLPSICFTVEYDETIQKITISCYGHGYCVGMSQTGANFLAINGEDYKAILAKYYEGTTLSKEENV